MQPFMMPPSTSGATAPTPRGGPEPTPEDTAIDAPETARAFEDVFSDETIPKRMAKLDAVVAVDLSVAEGEIEEAPSFSVAEVDADTELRIASADTVDAITAQGPPLPAVPERAGQFLDVDIKKSAVGTAAAAFTPQSNQPFPTATPSPVTVTTTAPDKPKAAVVLPNAAPTEGEAAFKARTTLPPDTTAPPARAQVPVLPTAPNEASLPKSAIEPRAPAHQSPVARVVEHATPQPAPPLPTTSPPTPVQTAIIAPLSITPQASITKSERSEKLSNAALEPFALGRLDGPGQSTSTTVVNPTVARADLAAHITRQVVEGAQHMPARPVEITLSPEELGRVRLAVSTHDAGITLNVMADRPETLDLLRRNIGQLGAQFEALGYENIAFSFQGGGDAQTSPDQDADNPWMTPTGEADPETAPLQIALTTGPTSGVDIRL